MRKLGHCYNIGAQRQKSPGLQSQKVFVAKLRQDLEAAVTAMVIPYTQGQTEGRVNKLKLIKRPYIERGKFNLLRR